MNIHSKKKEEVNFNDYSINDTQDNYRYITIKGGTSSGFLFYSDP
jgi:hypothetical protein